MFELPYLRSVKLKRPEVKSSQITESYMFQMKSLVPQIIIT